MAEELGLFEAMYTQRALRYIRPDPIPDALVRKVLEAGTRAPSGGSQQRWRFVIIKDGATKRWIQERYRNTAVPVHAPPKNEAEARTMARNDAAANHLAEHLHEVPVLILCCLQHDGSPSDINRGASVYPAVQNLLLAARALGIADIGRRLAEVRAESQRRREKRAEFIKFAVDDIIRDAIRPR